MAEHIRIRAKKAVDAEGGKCSVHFTLHPRPAEAWQRLFLSTPDDRFDAQSYVIFNEHGMVVTGLNAVTLDDEVRLIDALIHKTNRRLR